MSEVRILSPRPESQPAAPVRRRGCDGPRGAVEESAEGPGRRARAHAVVPRFLGICTFVAAALVPAAVAAIGAGPDLLTPDERDWLAAHPAIVLGAGEGKSVV